MMSRNLLMKKSKITQKNNWNKTYL